MGLFSRFRFERPAAVPPQRCSCGAPLDPLDLDYGFRLPDEVFELTSEELAFRIRGRERVFVLDHDRGFVRTLLPIRLDRGSLTLGVWLEISARQAASAIEVWELPAYLDLSFDGLLANDLEPWGLELVGTVAHARPRSQDELPRVVGGDEVIRDLLTRSWPREALLTSMPQLVHAH